MDQSEVVHALGRLEGKMDLLIDMHKGVDTRLSKVEKKVWYAAGAVGLLGYLSSHLGLPVLGNSA